MSKPKFIKEKDFNGTSVYFKQVNIVICKICCLSDKDGACLVDDDDCETHGGIWTFTKQEGV